MNEQQAAFKKRTGDDVFFGVGTFGTADDAQQGLGSCFRLQVDGVGKDLLFNPSTQDLMLQHSSTYRLAMVVLVLSTHVRADRPLDMIPCTLELTP